MDGTLLDTEGPVIQCWEEVCIAHGYQNPRPILHQMIGKNTKDSNDLLLAHFGASFALEELRQKKRVLLDAYVQRNGITVKPGAYATLEWLSEMQIPSAVASSTHREKVLSHLERTRLLQFFQKVVGGDQVQRGKPDPEIFLKTADEMQVRPERCVVFEDSPNGVRAAQAARMQVIMIPDLVEPTPEILQHVHHVLRSLEDAIPLLQRLFRR